MGSYHGGHARSPEFHLEQQDEINGNLKERSFFPEVGRIPSFLDFIEKQKLQGHEEGRTYQVARIPGTYIERKLCREKV